MQTRKLMRPMLRDWMSQETRGVAHFFLTHSLTTANHSFTHILSLTTARHSRTRSPQPANHAFSHSPQPMNFMPFLAASTVN